MNRACARTALVAVSAVVAMAVGVQPAARPASGAALLQEQAAKLRPLVESDAARAFLDATASLPEFKGATYYLNAGRRSWLTEAQYKALPEADRAGYEPHTARGLYVNPETRRYVNEQQFAALSEAERAGFQLRAADEDRYYQTRYGSPLVYARPLDLAAKAGLNNLAGKRIADYGYGTIGHLRLLASLGADVTGIDVDPFLIALYSERGDTGTIAGASAKSGRITLVDGLWPGGEGMQTKVGGGLDLFISKNTLKNGYVHPEQEVDKRLLVDLSVPEEQYVKAVHDALKPGGLFLIYNLSPRPSREGEKYIHWADGRCPFPRAMLEKAGFEVLAFDANDDEAARRIFETLEYPTKAEDGGENLFALYTMARRAN